MDHEHIKKSEQTQESDSNHARMQQVHTESQDEQYTGLPLYLQRSQSQLLQRQPLEEEDEEVQAKCDNCATHQQALEGEEKTLQEKSDNDAGQQHLQKEQAIQTKPRSHTLQAKLKIGAPNDKYEQEADRVADEVMRMPDATVQRQINEEEEEEPIQTKPIANTIIPFQKSSAQGQPIEEELQTKLTVSTPNDKYEQEADRVADQVMAMPNFSVQRQPIEEEEELQPKLNRQSILRQAESEDEEEEEETTIQTKSIASTVTSFQKQSTQRQPIEEEEEDLQAKSYRQDARHTPSHVSQHIKTLNSISGQPLPNTTRNIFETRFGQDFSLVRIHNDSQSAQSAKDIQARAYTSGHNIVFGAGQYSPDSHEGKRLLAHELTHVVQQNGKLAVNRKLQQMVFRAKEDEATGPQSKVITFIMGVPERRGRRKFYKSATKYWSVKGKTNVLVKTARTLADIFDYLSTNPPQDRIPWREVNIVSHAGEEGYLSFPIDDAAKAEDEKGFGHKRLAKAISDGVINPVPDNVIGRSTNINIHGCALGRSRAMLKQLSLAFGGSDVYAPVVYAPKHLQSYKYKEKYKGRRRRRRLVKGVYTEYLREYWAVEYPTSKRVSRGRLRRDFEKKFGKDPKLPNWRRAVRGAEKKIRKYYVGKKNDANSGIRLEYAVLPRRNRQKDYLKLLKKSPEGREMYEKWSGDLKAWKRHKGKMKKEIKKLYRLMRKWRGKNQIQFAAYRQQWLNLKQQYTQLRRFDVDHKTTREKDRIKTAIEIILHYHNAGWSSRKYKYDNPWVPRNKKKEINKLVLQTVGSEVFKRYQWSVRKKILGKWGIGNGLAALFRGVGKRSVYRINRPLRDANGKLYRPSREEAIHYGKYVPQHKYNVIIKATDMIWVGGAEERARKHRLPLYLEPHGY